MQNVELKAHLPDWDAALRACEAVEARFEGELHQIDTYFSVAAGRLKLREIEPGDDHLVFYHRPDTTDSKLSDYQLSPAPREVKALLANALGVIAVVEKRRTLWMWQNVRIHLDRVEDLGQFIEFEAVLTDGHTEEQGHQQIAHLREAFGIADGHLCATSYLEMKLSQS